MHVNVSSPEIFVKCKKFSILLTMLNSIKKRPHQHSQCIGIQVLTIFLKEFLLQYQ